MHHRFLLAIAGLVLFLFSTACHPINTAQPVSPLPTPIPKDLAIYSEVLRFVFSPSYYNVQPKFEALFINPTLSAQLDPNTEWWHGGQQTPIGLLKVSSDLATNVKFATITEAFKASKSYTAPLSSMWVTLGSIQPVAEKTMGVSVVLGGDNVQTSGIEVRIVADNGRWRAVSTIPSWYGFVVAGSEQRTVESISRCEVPQEITDIVNTNQNGDAHQLSSAINQTTDPTYGLPNAFTVENSDPTTVEVVIANLSNTDNVNLGVMTAWKRTNQIGWTVRVTCSPDFAVIAARIENRRSGTEMAVIENQCNRSSISRCAVIYLYSLVENEWEKIWTSNIDMEWPYSHASAFFKQSGIDSIGVKSSSWVVDYGPASLQDGRAKMFGEANAGPHRWFLDTWQRQGDGYVLTKRSAIPSNYNTLVEFMFALRNGGDPMPWVTSSAVVTTALHLGLDHVPYDGILTGSFFEGEQGGLVATRFGESVFDPTLALSATQPTGLAIFHLVKQNNQVYIDQIEHIDASKAEIASRTYPPFWHTYLSPNQTWQIVTSAETQELSLRSESGVTIDLFPSGSTIRQAIWSPDGKSLLIQRSNWQDVGGVTGVERYGPPELWVVRVEGDVVSEPKRIFVAPEIASILPSTGFQFGTWSSDGTKFTFWLLDQSAAAGADGLPFYVVDLRTQQTTLLSNSALTNPGYNSWSPNGTQLVFSNGGYRSAQIKKWLSIYDSRTTQISTVISSSELIPGLVAWSPHGDQIAFAAVVAEKSGKEWADLSSFDNPAIAGRRIYLYDVKRGAYTRLNQTKTFQDAPRWSSDGKTLYFVQQKGANATVIAVNPMTGEQHALRIQQPLPWPTFYYGQYYWDELLDDALAIELLGQ